MWGLRMQEVPSAWRSKPSLQRQEKEPAVLEQTWSQPPLPLAHSLTSTQVVLSEASWKPRGHPHSKLPAVLVQVPPQLWVPRTHSFTSARKQHSQSSKHKEKILSIYMNHLLLSLMSYAIGGVGLPLQSLPLAAREKPGLQLQVNPPFLSEQMWAQPSVPSAHSSISGAAHHHTLTATVSLKGDYVYLLCDSRGSLTSAGPAVVVESVARVTAASAAARGVGAPVLTVAVARQTLVDICEKKRSGTSKNNPGKPRGVFSEGVGGGGGTYHCRCGGLRRE